MRNMNIADLWKLFLQPAILCQPHLFIMHARKIIDAQQEKVQLELELGRRSFLEDKQKRNEKVNQSSRTHANEQIKSCSASGASYDFTGMEGKLLGGAGLLQDQGKLNQHYNSLRGKP